MPEIPPLSSPPIPSRRRRPFRAAVIRGLSVLVPPLLTIVFFVWIASTVNQNVLHPVEDGIRNVLMWRLRDILPSVKGSPPQTIVEGQTFALLESGEYVPDEVVSYVKQMQPHEPLPSNGRAMYARYVDLRFLQPHIVVPVFVCVFLLMIYLLGKFLAAGVGSFLWGVFEKLIARLPLVRNVYGSVKQVTDFMLNTKQFEYTRVVAIEYPRQGVWSVGFVTGESLADIRAAVNEPILAVLVPCSPMPMAARSVAVRKREVVELNMTVDQALQFIVSCGVVIPPHQRPGGAIKEPGLNSGLPK